MPKQMSERRFKFMLGTWPDPLDGIAQNERYWRIGLIEISKFDASFRVGFGAGLGPEARFYTRSFDVDGRKGVAVLFAPSETASEFLAGWVPPDREAEANEWVAFLNGEIRKVLEPAP